MTDQRTPTPNRLMIHLALALGLLLIVALLLAVAAQPSNPTSAQDDSTPTPTAPPPPLVELNETIIKQATVLIMQTYQSGQESIISCVGSGTLVSADGLILTNAHIALPGDTCRSDQIVIAVTVRLDEPPIPIYSASIVDSSTGLDLAVLRIDGYLDGRPVEPGTLQLPFVELGDSTALSLDDTIAIAGYPDFGREAVTLTRGTVNGFTAEARAGDRAWIRTSAVIPGTMSGGGAYNRDGKLIGIPTIAPARVGGTAVDCRVIQDTNLDGHANNQDGCVPVGGFITALRPSRLARGLVRASTLDIRQGPSFTSPDSALPAPTGEPTFDRLFFTTRINEAGQPTNVVNSVPAGTTSLYLFFDYANMSDGLVYEMRVTRDNLSDPYLSLPPVTWSGGQRGTWYIGSAGTVWPNGVYSFRLFIEGREVGSRSINIGGGPQENPGFSDIVFGLLDPTTGGLVGTSYVLPEGSVVQARFNYRNMTPDTQWTFIWYLEDAELYRETLPWDYATLGPQGTHSISATTDFYPGQYRLALYVGDLLRATADFVIAGGARSNRTQVFPPAAGTEENTEGPVFRWSSDIASGQPAGVVRSDFPAGTSSLYAFFNWRLLAPGTLWTYRWTIDGDTLIEVTSPWNAPPNGENFYLSLTSQDSLPDGTYGLSVSIANVTLETTSARVGLGQLPVDAFASAEGVQIAGRIIDADTGEGIPGALFIVLEAEYSVEDFLWNNAQVLDYALADSSGFFQLSRLLQRGTRASPLLYSVLVRAEGYLPVTADGIIVSDATRSPIELTIKMSRS